MKKNTLVHCFSLPTKLEKDFFLLNLPLWVASFNSLSKNNDMLLFCDKDSELIAKELNFKYAEIIPIAEKNRSVMVCLDAMKYLKNEKRIIYADTDIVSTKDFSILTYDIITQGIEYNNGWNLRNIIDFRKKYIDLLSDYYYNPADNNLFTYNAGFLGFNNLEFKQLYIDNWEKHIAANLKYNEFLQYDIVFGTHVEQVQLYSLFKGFRDTLKVVEIQTSKKEVEEFKNIFEVIRHDYYHPHGRHKHDDRVKRDILKYISLYCPKGTMSKITTIANDITLNKIMSLS